MGGSVDCTPRLDEWYNCRNTKEGLLYTSAGNSSLRAEVLVLGEGRVNMTRFRGPGEEVK